MSLRFEKFKNSDLGIAMSNFKEFSKEYALDIFLHGLAKSGVNTYRVKRQLLGLKQKGYFDISEENNKTFFKLTPKGLNLVELLKFSTGKLKWDKRWRVLIFDIPEKQRVKRDMLRRKLKELKLKQMQQSVWITPYPLPKGFTKFLKELRVRPYLFSLTVEHINREKELKEYFSL